MKILEAIKTLFMAVGRNYRLHAGLFNLGYSFA